MKMIGISDAASYLNQTTKQLQRWDNSKILPAHKTEGGNRYYYQEELDVMKQLLAGTDRETAAQLLGVSSKTLWRWDKLGKFKPRYAIGSKVYYDASDIDRYIKLTSEVQNESAIV